MKMNNYGYYPGIRNSGINTQPLPQPMIPNLKGHPVSSLEEVRATSIDFDGSVFIFPNLANDKIYTKQINMDGTSTVRQYELSELPLTPTTIPMNDNLVTKEEFIKTVETLTEQINLLKASASTETTKNSILQQQPKPTYEF